MTGGGAARAGDRVHELVHACGRAARAVTARNDAGLASLELESRSMRVLDAISAQGSPTIGCVATALELDRTTLTALLGPLARAGLIRISADPRDRRARRLALSRDGAAARDAAHAITRRVLDTLETELRLDLDALIHDLDRLGAPATSSPPGAPDCGPPGPGASRPRGLISRQRRIA